MEKYYFMYKKIFDLEYFLHSHTNIFATPWTKMPHSLPALKRECGVFGPGMAKNSIYTTGIKLASPQLVFATSYGLSKFFPP